MNKGMDNKGFSLVELIIVIGIMAVLIGILAPQYLKYVTNSRVVSDQENANQIAKAIDVAVADDQTQSVPTQIQGPGGTVVNNVPGLTTLPNSKVNSNYEWKITVEQGKGVQEIRLNNYVIYPDGALVDGGFYETYYVR